MRSKQTTKFSGVFYHEWCNFQVSGLGRGEMWDSQILSHDSWISCSFLRQGSRLCLMLSHSFPRSKVLFWVKLWIQHTGIYPHNVHQIVMLFPSVVSKLSLREKQKNLNPGRIEQFAIVRKNRERKGKKVKESEICESRKKIASHSMIIILFPSSPLLHILSNSFLLFSFSIFLFFLLKRKEEKTVKWIISLCVNCLSTRTFILLCSCFPWIPFNMRNCSSKIKAWF